MNQNDFKLRSLNVEDNLILECRISDSLYFLFIQISQSFNFEI